MTDIFKVGEFIVYVNGNQYELGKVKSIKENRAFVYYHEGDTASLTPFHCMHKLINGYTIKKSSLGNTFDANIKLPQIVRCKDCLLHGACAFERGLGEKGFCSQGILK